MTTLVYEKPQALRDLSADCHGIIAASAGTGKTYTLQHLVIEILLADDEVRLDEILLVTFTVAATSDLKAKIRQTLETLVDGWERARRRGKQRARLDGEQLVEPTGDETADDHWIIDLDGVQRLRRAVRNFDRASIYTIHGFCQRILVEHAFANRRLFEQEHVSEDDVIEEAFAELLRRDARPGTEVERWVRLYFDAGKSVDDLRGDLANYVKCTGQYRPMIEPGDVQSYIEELSAELELLDPKEWKKEIKPAVDACDADGVNGHTLNAVVSRLEILKDEFLAAVEPGRPVDNLFLLGDVFSKKFKYLRQPKSKALLQLAGSLGDVVLRILEYDVGEEQFAVARLGIALEKRVADVKSREGYFTFADMVEVVRDTLIEKDEDGHLLARIRSDFRYGLIDEFQDTDRAQWEIFERIFVESSRDDRHFLYLVGDPKQAIYGFRGGDVYTYLDACDRLRKLGAERTATTSLRDNYRSTPSVLAACNAIFSRGAPDPIDLGDRIQYEEGGVEAGRPDLELRIDGKPTSTGVAALELTTGREELSVDEVRAGVAEQYAREIAAIVDGDRPFSYCEPVDGDDDGEQTVDAGHIYVLCRRRAELDTVAEALRRHGVDFAFLKKPGLFQTQEARDVYDLLLALADPHDRSRRARAWMTPFFDLELTDLEGIFEIDERAPIFDRLLRWSRLAKRADFAELFDVILEQSGAIRRRLLLARGERELTNYTHLLEILADDGGRHVRTVEDLAVRLKGFIDGRLVPDGEDTDQQRIETEEKAVQLMTIHASKGLQRGLVFVVPKFGDINRRYTPFRFHHRVDSGDHLRVEWHDNFSRMPLEYRRRYEEEATAEELRLAYVAMTRAELMVFVPTADRDSPIYEILSGDPFARIVDRIDEVRRDHPAADHIAVHPRSIDVGETIPGVDEVRRSLEGFSLDGAALPRPEVSREQRRRIRRDLMLRRWEVTSYSKLKQRGRAVHTEDEKSDDDTYDGTLPGGMATGNFLHLVLEEIDYPLVDEFEREQWVDDEDLRRFFADRARRYGRFGEPAITRAMEIVYDTLRAPVELSDSMTIDGLRRLDEARERREVEFLFSVPELDGDDGELHRRFPSGAELRGGFVKGIVDLLFECDGKVYFADWKSDLAHPFDADALTRMVEQRYAAQANLYSLALARMLGITDRAGYEEYFGGYFYFFVRGMNPDHPGRGIYGGNVDWDELERYERGLHDIVRAAKTGVADPDEGVAS